MKNNLNNFREVVLLGNVDKEIHLRNHEAKIDITKNRQTGTFTFKTVGLVASFNGGSSLNKTHILCKESRELAKLIVGQGGIILNGGRSTGIMGATSRGAGKFSLGVIFSEQAKLKKGNTHNNNIIVNDFETRLKILTTCPIFIIFYYGGIGTLHELTNAIVEIKKYHFFNKKNPPRLLLHKSWKVILNFLLNKKIIKKEYLTGVQFFNKPSEAIKFILKISS